MPPAPVIVIKRALVRRSHSDAISLSRPMNTLRWIGRLLRGVIGTLSPPACNRLRSAASIGKPSYSGGRLADVKSALTSSTVRRMPSSHSVATMRKMRSRPEGPVKSFLPWPIRTRMAGA